MNLWKSILIKSLNANSDFSQAAPHPQVSTYVQYEFFDRENNETAYLAGTYLGRKKVFNLGLGAEYQANAMWHLGTAGDTVYQDMMHWAADLYYDAPLNRETGSAIHVYAAFLSMDFGKNYVRNLGVMNPADGVQAGVNNFNGPGNAYPMIGTGTTLYGQLGWLLPKNVTGERHGRLVPYISMMYAGLRRLNDPVEVYHAGLQWLIDGHRSKLGIEVENRPVFDSKSLLQRSRRNMLVIQYQIAI